MTRLRTSALLLALAAALASPAAAMGPRPKPLTKPAAGQTETPPATGFTPVKDGRTLDPSWLRPPSEPYRLGAGDLVEFELLDLPDSRRECTVMPDGLVYFDLLPGTDVSGLTLDEARLRLEKGLSAWYRTPRVAVTLRTAGSRRIWVLGRVNTPGLYPLEQPTTVLEAVARAGGTSSSRMSGTTEELASLRHAFVVRDQELLPVDFQKLFDHGDTSQNIYLQPGDYVYIPSSLNSNLYVLGAVRSPLAVGFASGASVLSTIAAAGGLRPEARGSQVLVIRGSLATPEALVVDVEAMLAGRIPDMPLQALDIVWVPDSPWTTLGGYVRTVLNTFVRTVAANEGARAGAPDAGKVDIIIPMQP